ncbi:MAG: hypothetical protein ABIS18_04055 [Actinomycetota bacterium]
MTVRKCVFSLFVVLLGVSSLAGVALAAPGNDNRADASVIGALPFTDGRSTTGASLELGELEASCSTGGAVTGASVWYQWTADANAPLVVDTVGSKFDTVITVYEGLAEIACNDDSAPGVLQSKLKFSAALGTQYHLRIAGYEGAQGYLKLSVDTDPMAFDAFALARPIASLPLSTTLNLSSATAEPGEPITCNGYEDPFKTVWFRLTVSERTGIRANTDNDVLLTAFVGDSLGSLSYLACNHDSGVVFKAEPGKTYYFQLALHKWNPVGDFKFDVEGFASPANDDFADAVELSGVGAKHQMSTIGATREAGETDSDCGNSSATVWYKITPITSESLVVTTQDSDFDTVLDVYTNESGLSPLACNDQAGTVRDQAMVGWYATAGMTYYIRAGGWYGDTGNLAIEIRTGATVENDLLVYSQVGVSAREDRFEAGVGAWSYVGGGGVIVDNDPEGNLRTDGVACAFALVIGFCAGL